MLKIPKEIRAELYKAFGGEGYIYYVKKKTPFKGVGDVLDFFAMGSFSDFNSDGDHSVRGYLIGSDKCRLYAEICFGMVVNTKDVTDLVHPPQKMSWRENDVIFKLYPKESL